MFLKSGFLPEVAQINCHMKYREAGASLYALRSWSFVTGTNKGLEYMTWRRWIVTDIKQ